MNRRNGITILFMESFFRTVLMIDRSISSRLMAEDSVEGGWLVKRNSHIWANMRVSIVHSKESWLFRLRADGFEVSFVRAFEIESDDGGIVIGFINHVAYQEGSIGLLGGAERSGTGFAHPSHGVFCPFQVQPTALSSPQWTKLLNRDSRHHCMRASWSLWYS